jgi:hypothetical protein
MHTRQQSPARPGSRARVTGTPAYAGIAIVTGAKAP